MSTAVTCLHATLLGAMDPRDYLERLGTDSQVLASIRWLIGHRVLESIPATTGIAYTDLARATQLPEAQLRSVVRMCITSGLLSEPEPGVVYHSKVSSGLAQQPDLMDWASWLAEYSMPTAAHFFEATKRWGSTSSRDETAFSIAMNKQLPFFDYLREEPTVAKLFSGYMRNVSLSEGVSFNHLISGFNWSRLAANAKVVDVGGSRGHACFALAHHFRNMEFIVQDLPEAIADAGKDLTQDELQCLSRFQFMQHDFFKPQPIVDGDVYLLRMILHNWSDVEAVQILKQLGASLQKPEARILIMDTILPPSGTVPLLQERKIRARDLTMLQVFNTRERELEDWNGLLRAAGLEMCGIQQPAESTMGVMEIRSAQNDVCSESFELVDSEAGLSCITPEESHGILRTGDELPVIIIGAGIGGLSLAQGLKKHGKQFILFERDPSMEYRAQGYRLKIEPSGATALKAVLEEGVYEAFEASCAITAVGQTDYNPINGAITRSRAGTGLAGSQGLRASYTVDRAVFRRILTTGIAQQITFGKELISYEIVDYDSSICAVFRDGSRVRGHFLVGADGIHSSVRKHMLPRTLYVDTGGICIYGKTPMTAELLTEFPAKGLRWMTACCDEAPSIQSILIGDSRLTLPSEPIRFADRSRERVTALPQDYIYWALIGRRELFLASDGVIDDMTATAAALLTQELTKEWDPSISSLLRLQDTTQCAALRVISAPPEIMPWKASPAVTLLGDAIHAMSPCGGVGANTALVDAADLAQLLGKATGALGARDVAGYEETMRKRAFGGVMRSFAGSKKMFDQRPFDECSTVSL